MRLSSFLWKSLCKRVKEKAFRAFTQKALSRAIQFAIIQRNYYITRKRRGQGALFGRVLVICQRLSGMSPPIPRRNTEYAYRHIIDDLVPPAARRLYLFENARVGKLFRDLFPRRRSALSRIAVDVLAEIVKPDHNEFFMPLEKRNSACQAVKAGFRFFELLLFFLSHFLDDLRFRLALNKALRLWCR